MDFWIQYRNFVRIVQFFYSHENLVYSCLLAFEFLEKFKPSQIANIMSFPSPVSRNVGLQVTPKPPNVLGVRLCVWVHKILWVVNCLLLVALVIQTIVCLPAIGYDGRSISNAIFYNLPEPAGCQALQRMLF